jgi:AcrR family transcriptional regulator
VTTNTRERLLETAMALFARQGLTATGIKQILEGADARFSSLYHYFPGGKDELAAEAIETAGLLFQTHVEQVWDQADDLVAAMHAVFRGAADALVACDYADACPIGTIAMEVASTNEPLRAATAAVYGRWTASARHRLEAGGLAAAEAGRLALVIVTLLEGAFVVCRATRSTDPMLTAGEIAAQQVASATNGHPTPANGPPVR